MPAGVAFNTRILDASAAELSELVLEHALRDLDFGDPPLESLPPWPDGPDAADRAGQLTPG